MWLQSPQQEMAVTVIHTVLLRRQDPDAEV